MIAFLANESPWPSHNGGRVRMAGLVSALAETDTVEVVVARGRAGAEVAASCTPLPPVRRSRLSALLGPGPRLGRGLLDGGARAALTPVLREAAAVVVSHSYLAAELPPSDRPLVVDFPNLEVDRQRGQGLLGRVEAWKAARWEPRVARRADLCLAVDEQDAEVLRRWGAADVRVVPNVVEAPVAGPSPVDGSVLAVADWRYGPNAEALAWLVDEVVPRLSCEVVLAGRGSEGSPGGLGFVEDLTPLYERAAVVLGPVRRGAGTQLKVLEALSRGRCLVTTSYGARSVPGVVTGAVSVADSAEEFARAVQLLVDDVPERHRREELVRTASFPRTWAAAAAPLLTALAEVARG